MALQLAEFLISLLIPVMMILSYTNVKGHAFDPTKSSAKCLWYNFGDSNSDTGSLSAIVGMDLNPPYGKSFFQESVGRFSDGRVYLDFICETLGKNYLSAYPEPLGSDFSSGANFATGRATAAKLQQISFSFHTQVEQFAHFHKRAQKLRSQGKGPMISDKDFIDAVYFVDIGQNDFFEKFKNNSSYQNILDEIPILLEAIEGGIKALYNFSGARKFRISNMGPLGCLPSHVALGKMYNITEVDEVGCVLMYNKVAKKFNKELGILCDKIRLELKDVRIVYTNMYRIKYDLFASPSKYGFENPLTSCCSACFTPMATVCPNPSKSVIWDDTHFTEAAHSVIASKLLSGKYATPRVKLQTLCDD